MLPRIVGTIDRRVLLNYRAPADLIRELVPEPFSPRIVNGCALVGVCLIRFKHLRPVFLPKFIGVASENAAHRISVEWDDGHETKTGVYVTRRDTNSALLMLVGGRVFPGVHSKVKFTSEETSDSVSIAIADGTRDLVRLDGKVKDDFESRVFSSHEEASAYFELDRIGYSPARGQGQVEGVKLSCHRWETSSLVIENQYVREFEQLSSDIEFDHALYMTNISHEWSEVPNLCCSQGVAPDVVTSAG